YLALLRLWTCTRRRAPPDPFFFTDTATTEISTLSLHDALPISLSARARIGRGARRCSPASARGCCTPCWTTSSASGRPEALEVRSEEHTSELQSRSDLVCRLLLEKKNKTIPTCTSSYSLRDTAS